MIIIPAIDLIDGKCVRLTKGDYDKIENYEIDPVKQAKTFESLGAKYLHIVDLDGAKKGKPVNFDVIRNIKNATNLVIECGGGIRDIDAFSKYIDAGIDYIILGSVIFKNPRLVKEIIEVFGCENLVASLDFKDGFVKVSGWLEDIKLSVNDGIKIVKDFGFKRLIYTDIDTDGMLMGHNIAAAVYVREMFDQFLIAAGGISSFDDIKNLKEIGVDGVIIGKALYTGKINLEEVLKII